MLSFEPLRDKSNEMLSVHSENIRILHGCEVLIEKKLSQGSQFGITRHRLGVTRLRRVVLNSDPRDRFVDQFRTLMIDSFSCTPMGADT